MHPTQSRPCGVCTATSRVISRQTEYDANVCTATSRVISRQTEYDANVTRPLLEACIAACQSCADECERHAEPMAHCLICAERSRECERACQDLLAAMR
jgi:Domain of Unknown Function (DUF326)